MENRHFEARKRISGALIRSFLGALGVLAVQILPIRAELPICPNHLHAFGGFVKFSSVGFFEKEQTEWANWRDFQAAHWPTFKSLNEPWMRQREAPPFPLFPPVKNSSVEDFLNRSKRSGPIGGICMPLIGLLLRSYQASGKIDDCRLMIVDLRCELENEPQRQASSVQKSKINIHQPGFGS